MTIDFSREAMAGRIRMRIIRREIIRNLEEGRASIKGVLDTMYEADLARLEREALAYNKVGGSHG